MVAHPELPRRQLNRIFPRIASGSLIFIGGAALAGWLLHIGALRSVIPGANPIKPNMAGAFLFCGVALALMSRRTLAKPLRICAMAMATSIVVMSALTLAEHFLGWNLPIEQWLIGDFTGRPETLHPGRMASASALGLFLTGSALLAASLSVSKKLRFPLVLGLSAALVLIGGLPLTAFLLELSFGSGWNLMGMDISGVVCAIGFMLVGSGLLALLESEGRLTWLLNRLTTAGFAFGILLMVVAAAAAFDFTKRMRETDNRVSHRQDVLREIAEVTTGLAHLGSNQRLYVILGDEQLLKDREETKAAAHENALQLRKLTADNLRQQRRLDLLEPLIARHTDWQDQTIAIRRQQGFTAAAQLIATGTGLKISEEMLRPLQQMQAEEYRLLETDRKQAEMASTTAFSLLPSGVFLSVIILLLGLFFLNAGMSEQAQAEKGLRRAEEKYRSIFENSIEGIFQTTLAGRFISANPALARMFGFDSAEELIHERTDIAQEHYVNSEHRQKLKELLEERGLVRGFEMEVYRKDGSKIWVRENALAVRNEEGAVVHYEGMLEDITERKRAEDALRASKAHLQAVVENLAEGVIVSDLEGNLLHWNRSALQLHGYSDTEQDRRRFTELVDTFELSTLNGALLAVKQWPLARILRDQELHNLELRLRRIGSDWERVVSYGGTLVHDGAGQPLMAIVTANDITERKRADEMLRGSEERYRRLFESNPNPMWVYDLKTLSFLAVNSAAVRQYEYSQEEFLAMTIKDIRPAEDLPALVDDLSLTTNGLSSSSEWRHRKKNGALINVEITSHEQTWLGRRAKLVLINDITERKRVEDEILQLNAELEERVTRRTADLEAANKELEAFSYSVSHDLRAPLRAVDGFSQAVLEDYGEQLPEEGKRYLTTIRGAAQRMGVLIDDLLTFSRLSRLPLHKQTIETARQVRDSLDDLDSEKRGRKIDISIGALPACHADPALLKQVWINLLSNALKYTRKRDAATIEIGCQSGNGEDIYYVRDNGTGFDMQYADKLFGVFQRLHRVDEFEGTGVGLAIVQRIIHRHGGRIWADAAVDRGATFQFTLGEKNNI
jgi:PAS domain S-box-containing protein